MKWIFFVLYTLVLAFVFYGLGYARGMAYGELSTQLITPQIVLPKPATADNPYTSKYGFMLKSEDQCLTQPSASFNSDTKGEMVTFSCSYSLNPKQSGSYPVVLN